MNRRIFLGTCAGGLLSLISVGVAYPIFRFLSPLSAAQGGEKASFPVDSVAEGDAKFFQFQGKAAVMVKRKDGGLIVLTAVCTHLGCVVKWVKDKEEFLCPCHAGRFSPDGVVLGGPPPKPLDKIPFSIAEGNVNVG